MWFEEKGKGKKEIKKELEELEELKRLQKDTKMVADKLLDEVMEKGKPLLGDAVISPALIDQRTTLNPVTLEGQAEIIYNITTYRMAKWRWSMMKADEYFTITPVAPAAFTAVMTQKERLESHIKAGLASVAQAVADYELLKHDERKYREILDFFKMGKKDEHVLRALYVDRVDAFMGEGYSMITMAKRWPTIISDFIKMKLDKEYEDVDFVRKTLHVSKAEAVVLKTKNGLFREWLKLFFPDVKTRYVRIKNLVESREKSMYEYREWLKPYLNRYRRIREAPEIKKISADFTDPLRFAHTPECELWARLWCWKPIRPEEMGAAFWINEEIDPYDDWVKSHIPTIEKKYGVKITDKDVRKLIEERSSPALVKREDIMAEHPAVQFDPRYLYYIFMYIDYQIQYKKGSTGPMVVEDQYFHIFPFVVSKNVLLLFLIELTLGKEQQFDNYVDYLIGSKDVEDNIRKEVELEFAEIEEGERGWASFKKGVGSGWKRFKNWTRPVRRFFLRPGPYEVNIRERMSKAYGDYSGPQVADVVNLIKETSYRISGQRP